MRAVHRRDSSDDEAEVRRVLARSRAPTWSFTDSALDHLELLRDPLAVQAARATHLQLIKGATFASVDRRGPRLAAAWSRSVRGQAPFAGHHGHHSRSSTRRWHPSDPRLSLGQARNPRRLVVSGSIALARCSSIARFVQHGTHQAQDHSAGWRPQGQGQVPARPRRRLGRRRSARHRRQAKEEAQPVRPCRLVLSCQSKLTKVHCPQCRPLVRRVQGECSSPLHPVAATPR